jgi:eukaryotic-like serine/threonine-protein kinase
MRSLALVLLVGGVAIVGLASVAQAQTQDMPLAPASDTEPTTPGRALLPWTAASRSPAPQVDGMELVFVPAGDFLMGSDDGDAYALSDEKPQHLVYLDAYWIDKTEVTNAMFARFVDVTGHDAGSNWRHVANGKPDHPVVRVNWFTANAYCEWAGRRLPTEAEWEKAARGTDGRWYPWGNERPDRSRGNIHLRSLGTTAVGSYPAGASPYGVLDMAGNVWEWVADWYGADYYARSPRENPTGPESGLSRALRGVSWRDLVVTVRAAKRYRHVPNSLSYNLGLRCARSPQILSSVCWRLALGAAAAP